MPYSTDPSATSNYAITIYTPAFVLLLAVLLLFVAMYLYTRAKTSSKRAMRGFVEATMVDTAFLVASVMVVVYLYFRFPSGNRMAWAISQVILRGYWLTFAIPIVTVGNSVHEKTRGAVAWRDSSIFVAIALFFVLLYLIYT